MNKALFINSEGQNDSGDFSIRFNRPFDLQGLKWNIAVNKLTLFNSWWNVSDELANTTFKYNNGSVDRTLSLEPGNYSFTSLVDHIHDKMIALGDYTLAGSTPVFSINFEMDLSDGFTSMILTDSYTVDFTGLSIRYLFGFASAEYLVSTVAPSKANMRIGVDQILLHCDLVNGNSVVNGRDSDIVFSFVVNAQPNEMVQLEPNHLPIGINRSGQIEEISLYLTDQANRKLNLRSTPFSCEFLLSPVI